MTRLMYIAVAALTAGACSAPGSTASSPTGPAGPGQTGTSLSPNASPIAAANAPTNFVAHLSGDNEIPPRETLAQGQAIFQLSPDGESLSYRLIAAKIENLVAAHIHLGAADENGPVVAFLFGPESPAGGRHDGVLATGTITTDDLVGPLTGMTLADLIAAMTSGDTYVNAHTNDGVAPTNEGPGDFPGGEIRGQIRLASGS
jgi:hypothetical protein